jgi:hypothetical protein
VELILLLWRPVVELELLPSPPSPRVGLQAEVGEGLEGAGGWREPRRGAAGREGQGTREAPGQVRGRGRPTSELAHDQEAAAAYPICGREKSEGREKKLGNRANWGSMVGRG